MKKSIIIGGAIVVLAGAATPYFMGSSIESKFREEVKLVQTSLKQTDPRLDLTITEYNRGWFTSSAKTVLTLNRHTLPIDNKITHGPFCYFGLAKIQSTFVFNDQEKAIADGLFDGKEPLLITTNIGFFGNGSLDIYSATINNKPLPDDSSVMINWGGMNGSFTLKNDQLTTDIKIPKLAFTSDAESFDMDNLTITGKSGYAVDRKKLATINWGGDANLNIDKLSLKNNKGLFSSKVNLTVVATDNNQDIGYESTLKLTDIIAPKQVSPVITNAQLIEFGFGINNIPKKPLLDLLIKMDQIQSQGKTPTDSEMSAMGQEFGIALLQSTPSINVKALISGKEGDASINAEAKLTTPDTTTDKMALFMGLIDRLVVTVSPTFSESLVDNAINRGELPITKEEFIRNITENNRFILNSGKFSGAFEYKQGQLYSNNQPDPDLEKQLRSLSYLFFGF